MIAREKRDKFNRALFRWYRIHGRHDLPWRKTHDPYKIFVSELMLQQTQVDRVMPKYKEFLRAFPNVHALSRAKLGNVLRVWSGLGYNRRAKYIRETARRIEGSYKGKFPRTREELCALSGVGECTASAIRAFAFGESDPMIDTNVRRVLVRVFGKEEFGQRIPSDKTLYKFANILISRGKGREWNWAMLDVGALVCRAVRHDDAHCPFTKLHRSVGPFQYRKPQSRFTASPRFYRGRVLVALHNRSVMKPDALARTLKLPTKSIRRAIVSLEAEGLLRRTRGGVRLP